MVFIGSKRMGLRCATAMHDTGASILAGIVTFDDRADGRHVFADLHRFAEQHHIPIAVTRSSADLRAAVRAADADLGIVCGWYTMIARDTLAAVPRGLIGVHNSLLPKYRGGAPLVWAMLNGEREVGLSMYALTNGMDDGDVWAQTSTEVGADEYIGAVLTRLEDACDDMIRSVYPAIVEGAIQPVPQDNSRATYGTLRDAEHGRIDWRQPADYLYRWIRAQSAPYPGGFTSCGSRRSTIWKAFYQDLGDRAEDVVLVTMSEFGRTARENGNGGTDHGHANVMFVLGGPVRGGKVYGRWPGLAPEVLYEGRDLDLTTDYRTVCSEILARHMTQRDLTKIFPAFHAPVPVGLLA